MKITQSASRISFLCILGVAAFPQSVPPAAAKLSGPEFLSFDELREIAAAAEPQGILAEKLNNLLTTPFLGRYADENGYGPRRPAGQYLGPVIRTAFWNIERGLSFDLIESALDSPERFQQASVHQTRAGSNRQAVDEQLRRLHDADVVVLNEVDLGMKRTGYRDVSRDLAAALHMNYAYAVEFVEVDPIFDLDIERIDLPDKNQEQRLAEDLKVDLLRYRGLHGNAVLSRYPIERARVLRLPVCYDWYGKEINAIAKLEQGKRWTAQKLFRERVQREVRRGGRMALMVDLAVPGLPTGKLTVVSAHLENKCPPACRQKQMSALLTAIRQIDNPVVLAGDLNTSGSDATPTSLRNEIMKRVADYRFWISQGISFYSPVPQYLLAPLRYFHSYLDPTAWHLPFIWENRERGLFKEVESFRFADSYAFDFRGSTERTLNNTRRTLADSNQRGRKGFVPTYAFERNFGGWVGNFKLDWFFVKPFIQSPRALHQSYRLAPHFPVTMRELNESVEGRISDHPPLTVDLPMTEPKSAQGGSR